jgi:hypothetical protein
MNVGALPNYKMFALKNTVVHILFGERFLVAKCRFFRFPRRYCHIFTADYA